MDAFEAELARRQADPHEAELARRTAPAPEPGLGEKALGLAKAAGSGIVKGATELPQLPLTLERGSLALQDYLASRFGRGDTSLSAPNVVKGPSVEDAGKAQDEFRAGRDATLHAPATTAEKYAETLGEFAPAAVAGPGSLARRLVGDVAIPAVASEGAGQLAENAHQSPVVQTIARIAAGGAANAGSVLSRLRASAPEHAIVRASRGVTDDEWNAAAQLQRSSPVALTGPEAVDQVTGGATRLGDVMRVVEGSSGGGATTKRFFSDRPAQVDAAVNAGLDAVTPKVLPPAEVAARVNDTATGFVRGAEKERTAQVEPLYTAAKADKVPASEMELILADLDKDIAADKTGKLSGILTELRDTLTAKQAAPERVDPLAALTGNPPTAATNRVPITDIENIDRARKAFRERVALPDFAANAIPKEQAAAVIPYLDAMAAKMEAASPNFAAGKQLYKDLTPSVEAAARTPLGQMAGKDSLTQQHNIAFPDKSFEGAAPQTADALRRMGDTGPNFLRQYLAQRFSEAAQDNMGGPNQWGGAKFASQVAGNRLQEENLRAALGAMPSQTVPQTWSDLLESLRATGQRKAPGSPTEPNRQLTRELGHEPVEAAAVAALTQVAPQRFWHAMQDRAQQAWLGRRTENLADLFTRPDSVSRLQEIAMRSQEHPALAALLRQAYETPLEVRR